jgi:sugar O-acyltransferase (sialic acid O-acetyltransferase NeuD family)
MKPIVLIGAGGHAASCIDVLEKSKKFKIVGLVGTKMEIGRKVLGYEVIGDEDILPLLKSKVNNAIVAVGQITSPDTRISIFTKLVNMGFVLPPIISPVALVSKHSKIGHGTIVFHGARINAGTAIGANCIINTSAVIEHGSIVGSHCHISTGALLNGEVSIGDGTFIGSGAIIRNGISIGNTSVIGMGSQISRNLPDNSTVTLRENSWLP